MNTMPVESTSTQWRDVFASNSNDVASAPAKDVKKSIWTGPKKAITAVGSMIALLAEAVDEGIEAEAAFRRSKYSR